MLEGGNVSKMGVPGGFQRNTLRLDHTDKNAGFPCKDTELKVQNAVDGPFVKGYKI